MRLLVLLFCLSGIIGGGDPDYQSISEYQDLLLKEYKVILHVPNSWKLVLGPGSFAILQQPTVGQYGAVLSPPDSSCLYILPFIDRNTSRINLKNNNPYPELFYYLEKILPEDKDSFLCNHVTKISGMYVHQSFNADSLFIYSVPDVERFIYVERPDNPYSFDSLDFMINEKYPFHRKFVLCKKGAIPCPIWVLLKQAPAEVGDHEWLRRLEHNLIFVPVKPD